MVITRRAQSGARGPSLAWRIRVSRRARQRYVFPEESTQSPDPDDLSSTITFHDCRKSEKEGLRSHEKLNYQETTHSWETLFKQRGQNHTPKSVLRLSPSPLVTKDITKETIVNYFHSEPRYKNTLVLLWGRVSCRRTCIEVSINTLFTYLLSVSVCISQIQNLVHETLRDMSHTTGSSLDQFPLSRAISTVKNLRNVIRSGTRLRIKVSNECYQKNPYITTVGVKYPRL